MSCSADGDEASPMVELSEWENINRLLGRQGCGAVHVSPRDELSGNGGCGVQGGSALTPGGVVLDPQASLELRAAIRSLVDDSERRQILIHGLIQCNSRLKDDVRLQQDRAGCQERRAEELQRILDDIKAKIRDLEDDFFCKTQEQQSEVTRLREEQEADLERCQKQEETLREQEQSIAQLRARITRAEAAEQKRLQDGRKSFQHLLRRLPQHNSPLHQQILDVVDGYESQVKQLQDEIRRLSVDGGHSGGSLNLDTTPNYKALIKSYQEQIQEARRKEEALQRESERLQRENERLQLEVKARPSTREFRVYKQQTRKMEKILAQNNLRSRGDKEAEPLTGVIGEEHQPQSECQRYLQRSSGVSPHVLQALVSHFQKLFDVPSVSGVFPKMNKVYTKVGEMDNALKTLRCLLGLGVSARAEAVVNAVGRLCRETGGGCSLPQILGTLDLDSVINKVQEHEQFFPAFEELIKDLLDLLEITHLEEIVPEVQRLKEVR
ncbi:centrosomal protein of 70 kDa isoform X2 [Phyllobates terribilis]|uniref:centrosomal protein of 70 kDa isoform X2 n=1 Tax=Phyllobates terribilis TaxID=111132 RepID=UPI003CCB55B6